ncbi:hypothetical protein K466DRAFT_602240 [Polyporus arcularius HHB13444]|uniref:F-box domain-containing protein n=1 Tax=Polyporus arcularius HHB13444 TaxID=1314778 RepID=A0A5C3P4K7_9APHY|nr:hypothetical protein K466DRAFT_602240 [Polyporus arcularius HHB13444]
MPQLSDQPLAVLVRVCQHLDLVSLFKFRRTSHILLDATSLHLKACLLELVGRFVPDAHRLLEFLTEIKGYVGGDVALAFLLRDMDLALDSLELFLPVTARAWNDFESHLIHSQSALKVPENHDRSFPPRRPPVLLSPGTRTTARFTTPRGTLLLYRSHTSDALVPISQQWASHRLLYVNLRHSGAAYPRLLFKRRALLGTRPARPDGRVAEGQDLDELVRRDAERGFDVRLAAHQWEELAVHGCGADVYLCASQARTFNDAGSLGFRLSPLADRMVATWVEWRLPARNVAPLVNRDNTESI